MNASHTINQPVEYDIGSWIQQPPSQYVHNVNKRTYGHNHDIEINCPVDDDEIYTPIYYHTYYSYDSTVPVECIH